MSGWITPKTDWTPEDYINVEDWNRIVSNLNYLKRSANELYGNIPWKTLTDIKAYNDFPNAEEWNNVAENLESLNQNAFALEIGQRTLFYENGPMVDYVELNRIESAILQYELILKAQKNCVPVLPFVVGAKQL